MELRKLKAKEYFLKDLDKETIQKISRRSLKKLIKESIDDIYLLDKVPLKTMQTLIYQFSGYYLAEIPEKDFGESKFFPLIDLITVKINL